MIAVYPGSFDPVTAGHLDIIKRSALLYEEVVVLVATNSSKKPLFSVEERLAFLEACCRDLKNVRFDALHDGLLVQYAQSIGARTIVKGLRAVSDFEYEFQMALLNRKLAPEIETVFLMTSAEYSFLSSSIIKEIARLGGNIAGLVPEAVREELLQRFKV
jgi:pantetheine-phosphate adenylyltransferase